MTLIILTFVLFIALVLGVYIIYVYNSLIRLRNEIYKAWSDIEVILKQRNDEIPKIVDVCKEYMKYEKDLLENITNLRTKWIEAKDINEKVKLSREISGVLGRIIAVAENYPELKANQNFLHLQKRISGLETEISDRREYYNHAVTNYNSRIQSFPDMIFAKIFGFKEMELFKATEEEKKDVNISNLFSSGAK